MLYLSDKKKARSVQQMDEEEGRCGGPLLDVCAQNPNKQDHEIKEIYAYGVGLRSILSITGLSKFINLESLSLHGNQIERIQGLEVLQTLKTLNLSSNNISQMEGLSHLQNLHVLNLASNQLREISGLHGLMALRVLVLSHNRISLLGGLSTLHGPKYSLEKLDLRDNAVEYLCELWVIAGCVHLRELTLSHGSHTNPVCWAKSYQTTILSAVPHLRSLDGKLLDNKDDAIIDLEAVSVPPLPVWALQRCYPPQQNCPKLPRFCSHLPTAPKASKYPSAKVQHAAQQHYHNPVQAAMQANDAANSMHNFQPERRNQSSDPHQIHLPYDNVVKANYGGSSLELVNHQRNEDKWRMPLPESNVGAVSHMRWSPGNQGERQLPPGPQLYNPFEAVPVDEMVTRDVPTNIQGGQTHALYGALATPHIDHALLGFHRRKKLHQSGGGEAIMEEPLQKETQNYEVWLKRLESQIIDLVHQISKTKADGTKRSSGMDSTTKTTKLHRDTDDDSSDLSLGNSPPKQSSMTPNHIPKFAGQKKKWCPVQAIRKMQKMAKHSSVQTESMEEPLLKRLCQEVGSQFTPRLPYCQFYKHHHSLLIFE